MDRIDLQIEVPAVTAADLALPAPAEGTQEAAARVHAARAIQQRRAEQNDIDTGAATNAEIPTGMLEQLASPDEAGRQLLVRAAESMRLTARGYHRVLRTARTIADLENCDGVRRIHIAEALGLRRAQNPADETFMSPPAIKVS